MATRKRSTRSSSRSPKRSSSRSSSRTSSTGSLLALAVIVGVGALSIWVATQPKKSQTTFSSLFERIATRTGQSTVAKPETTGKQPAKSDAQQENSRALTLVAPVPRPSVAVGVQPVTTKPVQRAELQPLQPEQRPHLSIGPAEKAVIQTPRGINMPNMMPSVVYARERLTLRSKAWDKSAPAGTVEKGREMRSYSKTGKWHRIVVPATDMIGWVHEDMLITVKSHAGISNMATGAIFATPKSAPVQAVYPPRPVGPQ